MSNDSMQQHGPEGGAHICLWCGQGYRCMLIHQPGLGHIRLGSGGRCCPECKAANMKALDKLGVARGGMFQ